MSEWIDEEADAWTDGHNKYVLNTHCVPGSTLDSGDWVANKTKPMNKWI